MKTVLALITLVFSFSAWSAPAASPNELIPFYFEKSGTQVQVIFRHSLIYASTRNLMMIPAEDIQPLAFLSFDYLPSDKYYACAVKQLEELTQTLSSSAVAAQKDKFKTIHLSVLINPTPAATTFCLNHVRSSKTFLAVNVCIDDSLPLDKTCNVVKSAEIIPHYTARETMMKNRETEEARMKKAAEDLLSRIKP